MSIDTHDWTGLKNVCRACGCLRADADKETCSPCIQQADDAEMRGLPPSGFKIVCNCGRERKYIFSKYHFDIKPCPYCKESGISSRMMGSTGVDMANPGDDNS